MFLFNLPQLAVVISSRTKWTLFITQITNWKSYLLRIAPDGSGAAVASIFFRAINSYYRTQERGKRKSSEIPFIKIVQSQHLTPSIYVVTSWTKYHPNLLIPSALRPWIKYTVAAGLKQSYYGQIFFFVPCAWDSRLTAPGSCRSACPGTSRGMDSARSRGATP